MTDLWLEETSMSSDYRDKLVVKDGKDMTPTHLIPTLGQSCLQFNGNLSSLQSLLKPILINEIHR